MRKKIGVLLFVFSLMFVLVGWGKKEVELLDSSKLIDLEKAIELAKPGGMAGESEEDTEGISENVISDDDRESETDNLSNHDNLDVVIKSIIISIREERISYTCGNKKLDNISATKLGDLIRSDYVSGIQVTLMDDYAESHVYKNTLEILDELKSDIDLTYKESQVIGDSNQ